jgi:hypothetical protein
MEWSVHCSHTCLKKEKRMFQIAYILIFVGAPLFVLITYLLSKRAGAGNALFKEESIPLADEEIYRTIPAEFLQNLRFSVRYSPVKKKFGSGQNYVYLEEQLRYGNVPLTDWIKHDVPIKEGFQPSPQVLRKISLLKQYDPKKAIHITPKLDAVASGGGR